MDTKQVVSPAQDVSLAGTDSQNPMPAAESVADMTVRAELKSERVQIENGWMGAKIGLSWSPA